MIKYEKKYFFIFISVLILILIGFNKANTTNIKKYLNNGTRIDTHAKNFMPAIVDLPKYQDISYKYNHVPRIFFETDTITLVVKYDEETYKKEKENLTEKYRFLDHKVVSDFDVSEYYIPEYEFSINDYDFKVADGNDNYETIYPKSFGMIGISDKKKSIAYLYFYDYDLDYIQKDNKNPMVDFVKKYFKYDF
ncbi:hypothetical protein [uncultured Clostridium sp.]|uniref:hypothetical protein n=1 Tax=uncultured Clostridium sp. TaxID=59620 RepID=UPI003217CF11